MAGDDAGGTGPGKQPPWQQPWGPPPGAAGPPPWAPPPRRKRSRWFTIGLPIGVLLLLGGCGTLAVLAFNAFTDALGPAKQVADDYATALVEERWDDAHGMLCDAAKADITPEDLASLHGGLADYSLTGIEVNSSGGRTTGQATITFVTDSGLDDATLVPLVKDGDDWRPCP